MSLKFGESERYRIDGQKPGLTQHIFRFYMVYTFYLQAIVMNFRFCWICFETDLL